VFSERCYCLARMPSTRSGTPSRHSDNGSCHDNFPRLAFSGGVRNWDWQWMEPVSCMLCHNMHSLQWACSLDLVMPFEKEHLATFAEVSGGHQERLREVCRTFRQMVICGCLVSNIALAMLEIFRCALREQTHKNAPPALNRGSSPEEISFRQSMEPVDAATSNCI